MGGFIATKMPALTGFAHGGGTGKAVLTWAKCASVMARSAATGVFFQASRAVLRVRMTDGMELGRRREGIGWEG